MPIKIDISYEKQRLKNELSIYFSHFEKVNSNKKCKMEVRDVSKYKKKILDYKKCKIEKFCTKFAYN
jgi:hypothetical protein